MATEYISREAAFESLEKIKSYLHQPYPEYSTMMFWEVEDFIDTLPAADVRPVVRGKWIDMGDFEQCSHCTGTHLKEIQTVYGKAIWIKYDFCPNCGADMREVDC